MMYEIHNSYFYFTFYEQRLQFIKGSTMYFVNYSYWQHPTVTVVSFFLTKSQLLLNGLKPCSHFFYCICNATFLSVHTNMMFSTLLSVFPLLLCTHLVNTVCSVLALIEIKCLAEDFIFLLGDHPRLG